MSKTESTLASILLAGLGALAETEEEGTKLFSHLVERGQRSVRTKAPAALKRAGVEALGIDWNLLFPEAAAATPSSAVETSHLRRKAEARVVFLDEFGTLTSREVADNAGSTAANRAALANRWKAEGRIFAVETGGQTRFPAFQFSDDDGQPRTVIAEILKFLQPRLSGWQTALWFTGRNGWLGAKRPVDILTSDPNAAVEAARQEAEAFD